jgi:leucyl-tRNA synthetase
MVLHDLGFLSFEEPFRRLRLHGFVTNDGAKMSKSRGNVVNPDEYIGRVGADAFRAYLLFMGPFDQDNDFRDLNLTGVTRYLERVWRMVNDTPPVAGTGVDMRPMHRFTKRVTEELEKYQYHTAIAGLMEFGNWIGASRDGFRAEQRAEALQTLVLMLAPFAPFLAEELWEQLGGGYSVHQQMWPAYDAAMIAEEQVELAVQVNGKVRDRITAAPGTDEAILREQALASERVQEFLGGRTPRKIVVVPDRLISIVG